MILLIRGHIRDSFDNPLLYNLIKKIYVDFPNLKIYIHTWDILSNAISWRKIKPNNKPVSENLIYNYFKDLKFLIYKIIIDNDLKINLIGNLSGNINNKCKMPILGWKNYWYGKNKIIDYMYNQNIDSNEMIINFRFDLLNNYNSAKINEEIIINFINKNINVEFSKNIFIFENETTGMDNIYIGNINTMYKLSQHFLYEFDKIILDTNNYKKNQEYIVFRENNKIFQNI